MIKEEDIKCMAKFQIVKRCRDKIFLQISSLNFPIRDKD